MADGLVAGASALDLGDDLNCAICMQLLFQPLTLIECTHTFCGACLKDWFAHQAATARSLHPYTCPSCREEVKSTRRVPLILNIVENHLRNNPQKDRPEDEKKEHVEKYKPGDNVLPKLRLRGHQPDPEDERVLNEVMQLSLQEAGISESGPGLSPPQSRRRGHSRGNSRSRTSSRSPGPLVPTPIPAASSSPRRAAPQVSSPPRVDSVRQVQHQSSLISLLSVSEMDPSEMQEEITRMINEEGLLDDVDLSNLDSTREDELSERIAAAYRRRKEEARQRRRQANEMTRDGDAHRDRSGSRQSSSRPSSRSGTAESASRHTERPRPSDARAPPISNPQLIDSANQGQSRHRRTGSGSSSRSAVRIDSGIVTSSPTLTPVLPAMSFTEPRPRRPSDRSATDPTRSTRIPRAAETSQPTSLPSISRTTEPFLAPTRTHIRQRSDSNPQRSPRLGSASTFPRTGANHSTPSLPLNDGRLLAEPLALSQSAADSSTDAAASVGAERILNLPLLFTEPSISCDACHRQHIEYDVHFACRRCSNGHSSFNLCRACYLLGKGHRHALEKANDSQNQHATGFSRGKPHLFTARRYARPKHALEPVHAPLEPTSQSTEEDPVLRLEEGVFCDLCSSFANNCYWKCDACNDGEWGYCNSCVNQGRHCTHPLQPLKAMDNDAQHPTTPLTRNTESHLNPPANQDHQQQLSPPSTPKTASIIDGPVVFALANLSFKQLTFHTECDICHTPIPPSVTRYHCPQCNDGDYDICMKCYHGLVSAGKISQTNGPQGWRKCLQNHRMVVVGFQDAAGGQRRVIDRDIVGGWTFAEGHTQSTAQQSSSSSRKWRWKGDDGSEQAVDPQYRTRAHSHIVRLPPDGGIGLVFYGKWNYFPEDATEKDLCFPKGAEIREAEDINGEWLWGYYAGKTGLFPAAYVDLLRKVTM